MGILAAVRILFKPHIHTEEASEEAKLQAAPPSADTHIHIARFAQVMQENTRLPSKSPYIQQVQAGHMKRDSRKITSTSAYAYILALLFALASFSAGAYGLYAPAKARASGTATNDGGAERMDIVEQLQTLASNAKTLPEFVDAFEEMCKIPLDSADDDLLLFQTGVFNFTGEEGFYFSLVRQYMENDEDDEFIQLHLDLLYQPDEINAAFSDCEWSLRTFEEFFYTVRNSKAYQYIAGNGLQHVQCEIFQEGT